MERIEYFPVIAVKTAKTGIAAEFSVCNVPDGALLKTGDLVLFNCPDRSDNIKGVCVSNVLYMGRDTLDMICRITGTTQQAMPTISGKISIDWYTNKEVADE